MFLLYILTLRYGLFMGNAEEIFARIVNEAGLEVLVADSGSENLWLDFKEAASIPGDDFKKNLGKYISGFSNSDGGVLIYGVKENRAEGNKFFTAPSTLYLDYEKRIQDLISRATSPVNNNIAVKLIQSLRVPGSGYVIVLIPKSEIPPIQDIHQKKYFKRAGESHVPLEHYEIADFFGRRQSPVLEVVGYLNHDTNSPQSVLIEVKVANKGRAVAKFPFIQFFDSGLFNKAQFCDSWFFDPLKSKINGFYSSDSNMVIQTGVSVLAMRFHMSQGAIPFGSFTEIFGRVGCDGMPTREFRLKIKQAEVMEVLAKKILKELKEFL